MFVAHKADSFEQLNELEKAQIDLFKKCVNLTNLRDGGATRKYLENLELQAADAKELGAMNTIRKDVNRLLNKKDFDEPLRFCGVLIFGLLTAYSRH